MKVIKQIQYWYSAWEYFDTASEAGEFYDRKKATLGAAGFKLLNRGSQHIYHEEKPSKEGVVGPKWAVQFAALKDEPIEDFDDNGRLRWSADCRAIKRDVEAIRPFMTRALVVS